MKKSSKLKKGFWSGLLSFLLAKITHLLVTFSIGFLIVIVSGGQISESIMSFIIIIDGPIVGWIYIIIVTTMIYNRITE